MKRPRIRYAEVAPAIYEAMDQVDRYLGLALPESLLNLARLRASQLNGCAYCIDAHWKDLRASGESEQRLYSLDAWRESSFYSDRERAALEWTEAVTNIAQGHTSDPVFDAVRTHFSEKELADVTLAIATINAWNRLSIAARLSPAKEKDISAVAVGA